MENTQSIPMTEVDSHQIHSVGYDTVTNTLAVRFRRKGGPGALYHYPEFPADKHEEFRKAESYGSHFNTHIKDKFGFVKIEEPEASAETI